MNTKELEEIKARHFPTPSGLVCDYDTEPWPCDVKVVLAKVERLREGLRAILREHQESRSRPNLCRLCGAHDNWPCVTVLEARAALEGEDET